MTEKKQRLRLVNRVTPEMVATMRALRTAGYRRADIAYEVGVSPNCVGAYAGDLPIALHSNRTPASVRPRDPAREARIVAAAKTRALQEIADQEGITRERVRQIVVGYMKRTGEVVRRRRSKMMAGDITSRSGDKPNESCRAEAARLLPSEEARNPPLPSRRWRKGS